MSDPELVITSSNHPTATWPHAIIDCLSNAPCPTCYCYVCDVPIAQCDDSVTHTAAEGCQDSWNIIKRRRLALVDNWTDIPTLVNLIVSLSVEEAVRRADARCSTNAAEDVHLIADAFERAVNIKRDAPSVPVNKPHAAPTASNTHGTPQVEDVQVRAVNIVKTEPH